MSVGCSPVEAGHVLMFARSIGDPNPVYRDAEYAAASEAGGLIAPPTSQVAGYTSVFAHGMLTMGCTGRMLSDLVGDGRLLEFGGRFTAQVWPGDDLTATATVDPVGDRDGRPVVELAVSTTDQDGVDVFSGRAAARIEA